MFDKNVVQDLLGYQFQQSKLLDEALSAAGSSMSDGDAEGDRSGNKRLAFVGDALIRLDVANEWYASGASTAEAHARVQRFGTNHALSDLARSSGIVEYVVRNPCEKNKISKTTAASTMEALIGAVWFDSGNDISQVHRVIRKLHTLQGS